MSGPGFQFYKKLDACYPFCAKFGFRYHHCKACFSCSKISKNSKLVSRRRRSKLFSCWQALKFQKKCKLRIKRQALAETLVPLSSSAPFAVFEFGVLFPSWSAPGSSGRFERCTSRYTQSRWRIPKRSRNIRNPGSTGSSLVLYIRVGHSRELH